MRMETKKFAYSLEHFHDLQRNGTWTTGCDGHHRAGRKMMMPSYSAAFIRATGARRSYLVSTVSGNMIQMEEFYALTLSHQRTPRQFFFVLVCLNTFCFIQAKAKNL
jgi:hypothetical protein